MVAATAAPRLLVCGVLSLGPVAGGARAGLRPAHPHILLVVADDYMYGWNDVGPVLVRDKLAHSVAQSC